ncbi:MAG: cytochrome c maturation protein CcmE [Chloroflexi bacterium]|nr:cytochrome c maturation protein CcmE [Chloroflexota bacterium]
MLRKKRSFIIGGSILFIAIAYLGFMGIRSSASFYYTVSQLVEKGDSVYGQALRIQGEVLPGSVEQKASGLTLTFTITEGGQSLPVFYRGVVPDTFKPGGEIVIAGKLGPDGVFQADTLMPKCPSKYEPQKEASLKDKNSWQT